MQSARKPITHRLICDNVALPSRDTLIIEPATIDIAGSVIAAVYRNEATAPPLAPHVICERLHSVLVTPSYVDAHTHLALTCLRGLGRDGAADANLVETFFYKIEQHMTPDDIRAFVRVGGLEAMMSGTGLVWDHYYFPEAIADGLRDIGLAGVVAPTVQDRGGPGVAALDANIDATIALATSSTSENDGVFSALGLHATDTVSPELLQRCIPLTEKYNLPVHCHVAQSLDEVERVHRLDGCSPGTQLIRSGILDSAPHSLLVHGIFLTDDELEALGQRKVTLALCPHSKQIFAYLPDLKRWMTHDVQWVVGTDCAASNDAWSVPRELRFIAGMRAMSATWSAAHQNYLSKGGPALAKAAWKERGRLRNALAPLGSDTYVLDKGWRVPGAMHPAFRAGEVSEGSLASLAVWDTTHPSFWPNENALRTLVWGRTDGALKRMMINGSWSTSEDYVGQAIAQSDMWKEFSTEASERLAMLMKRAS